MALVYGAASAPSEINSAPVPISAVLQVVAAALSQGGEEGLHRLVRTFRHVFVAACLPKYLPANWAVDAVDSREFGEYSVYAKEDQQMEAAAEGSAAAAAAVGAAGLAEGAAAGVSAGPAAGAGETAAGAAAAAAAGEDGVCFHDHGKQAVTGVGGGDVLAVDGQHAADMSGLSIFARQGAASVVQ
jgi:hypothetical protein